MTARITPEDNSQDPNQTHQQSLQYEEAQPTDFDKYYVPEREFVLMPLFRRIGRMLGIKQAEEPEYVYAPETTRDEAIFARERTDAAVEAPAEEINFAPHSVEEMPHAESLETVAESYSDEELIPRQADDILGLESEAVSHFTVAEEIPAHVVPVQAEAVSEEVVEPVQQQTYIEAPFEEVAIQAHPQQEIGTEPIEQVETPKHEPETLVAAAAAYEMPQPISAPAGLSHDEVSELANQIREAATRISAAVAQAAEWLHAKEEEILRRTEMPLAPEHRSEQEPAMPRTTAALRAPEGSNTAAPEWEPAEVPALQRERAWQEKKAALGVVSSAGNQRRKTKKKPFGTINVTPLLNYWRRIDWAQEFAPKRVAILGGVLMAILMILGISFARRPASSDLPQQTRTIAPGGVTLTTHSPVSAAAPAVRSQSKPVAAKPSTESSRTRRSSAVNSEPDVVTHYYGKKPSPSHPATTVAGVKHYSDMQ